MNKPKFETPDMVEKNIEKLAELFPNCVTEARGDDGKLKKAVNFEMLQQILSTEFPPEGAQERYEFTWVGKRAAIAEANKPIRKTLRPCKTESKNWDTTENLYIEGDNLEVLKLLQESYLGKVKMIYIDPPYNTGNDFIYRDDFKQTEEAYNQQSGVFDEDDNRLFKNTETNGRFHSDWCSMIYSRLMLAKNFLSDDGVIFISIGEVEQANMRALCNEIFGEDNYISLITRVQKKGGNKGNFFNPTSDFIYVYSKNKYILENFVEINIDERIYNKIEEAGPRKGEKYAEVVLYMPNLDYRPNQRFYIDCPDGSRIITPIGKSFRWSENRFKDELSKGNVVIKRTKNSQLIKEDGSKADYIVYQKRYYNDTLNKGSARPNNLIENYQNNLSSKELEELGVYFDYPKPSELIKYLCSILNSPNNTIIMDFFSGSATTAHAVMQLNAEDGGHRKFIMVQLPEVCNENSEAFKAGYKNICEIGKERIRRAGEKIKADNPLTTQDLDVGFRVFKVDSSNMNDVYYSAGEYTQDMLAGLEYNIKPDRTDLDLLFGCLLDWGLPISLPYTSEQIENCTVHTYNDGDLIACFDENVLETVIKEIAKRKPLRAVFRDASFSSSPEKINVTEIFKMLAPDTDIKVI